MPSVAGKFRQRLGEEDLGFQADDTAFLLGKRLVNMDDIARVLQLLADRPQDAGGLSTSLGLSRRTLFTLLMKMEKEDLIEWKNQEWAVKPSSSDSGQNGSPDSSRPSEGGSRA